MFLFYFCLPFGYSFRLKSGYLVNSANVFRVKSRTLKHLSRSLNLPHASNLHASI